MTLSDFLALERISQREFARRLGVHQSTIARIISLEMSPSREMLIRIALETGRKVLPADIYADV